MHIADLHLGRKYESLDLLQEQRDVLNEIVTIMRCERPDGLMICGDVYDRSVPPAEAVTVLNDFLNQAGQVCPVLLISGNHDSGERLSFAAEFLKKQQLYVCGEYCGSLTPVTIGDANIYMLPHVQPANVAYVLGKFDEEKPKLTTMEQAVSATLATRVPGTGSTNILMAHLFAVSQGRETEITDSEVSNVGTLEQVDVSAFSSFDYVALGHLHRPQYIGRETVRYSGTPLAYSFSEDHAKSVTMVECENSQVQVRTIELTCGHRMRTVTGMLDELTAPGYDAGDRNDYIQVKLLDKSLQVDARARLQQVFPLLIGGIQYPNYEGVTVSGTVQNVKDKDDDQLLDEFWQYKKGEPMPDEYHELLMKLLKTEE